MVGLLLEEAQASHPACLCPIPCLQGLPCPASIFVQPEWPLKAQAGFVTSASRKAELMGGDRKQVSRRISPRGCLPHPDLGSNPDPTTSQLRTCAIILHVRHWAALEGEQIKTWVFFFAFKSPERGPWRRRAWRWDGCILLPLECDTPSFHPSRFPCASFLHELSIDLEQQCPVFLAQSFLEDSFSTDLSKEWFGDDSSA